MMDSSCYMCGAPATTREHVPPLSFFPDGRRENLITVPSCETHNNRNSKDVEYIKNIITTSIGVNSEGLRLYQQKTRKSFQRSPKLFKTIFQNVVPVKYNGVDTIGFEYSIERFNKLFEAIGYGLYFHDNGIKYSGEWIVVNVDDYINKKHMGMAPYEPYEILFKLILNYEMEEMCARNPDVFRYLRLLVEGIHIYLLVFYKGFEVVLVS